MAKSTFSMIWFSIWWGEIGPVQPLEEGLFVAVVAYFVKVYPFQIRVDEGAVGHPVVLLTTVFGDEAHFCISDLLGTDFFGSVYSLT